MLKKDSRAVQQNLDKAQKLLQDIDLSSEKAQEVKEESYKLKSELFQQLLKVDEKILKMKSAQSSGAKTRAPSTHISDDEGTKKDIFNQLLQKSGYQKQLEDVVNMLLEENRNHTLSELQAHGIQAVKVFKNDHKDTMDRIKQQMVREMTNEKQQVLSKIKQVSEDVEIKMST